MNKQQFNEALCFIDADIVDGYIQQKDALKAAAARKNMWLRVGAVAACFCVMVAAIVALPMMLRDDPPPVVVDDTTPADTTTDTAPPADTTAPIVITDPNTPPKAPILDDHGIISGPPSLMIDNPAPPDDDPWTDYLSNYYRYNYDFYARIVVEAKVIEVLPDIYYMPDEETSYHVVRLEILDEIHGEGLPKEIYYTYAKYDETIFDGYDTFIFSLEQIGIENYVLINKTQGKVEFFPQMFSGCSPATDPIKGTVIAFSDGVLDVNFWRTLTSDEIREWKSVLGTEDYYINRDYVEDTSEKNYYPARLGDTVQTVKQRIIDTIALHKASETTPYTPAFNFNRSNPSYVTAEQIFTSEARKQLLEYVSPSENNVFYYDLNVGYGKYLDMTFYRIIHGCETYEEIYMGKSEIVYKSDATKDPNFNDIYDTYTPEQLQNVPDISYVINNLDLSALTPPHITLDENTTFRSCKAKGWYRCVNGKVYGIIRIYWQYDYENGTDPKGYIRDDMYYLYDSDGNGRIVERDELRAVIGNDKIYNFDYELLYYYPWVDY